VLAAAGLRRLAREREIAFTFEPREMTPAPGQGALALEARRDDAECATAAARITDSAALAELSAERAATSALGASCHTPIGINARAEPDAIRLQAFVGLPDGAEWVRDSIERPLDDPAAAGRELAERMLAAGAEELLRRAEAPA
jgi:hydroxymethylbilane synthase